LKGEQRNPLDQVSCLKIRKGKSTSRQGPHRDTYQTPEVENLFDDLVILDKGYNSHSALPFSLSPRCQRYHW